MTACAEYQRFFTNRKRAEEVARAYNTAVIDTPDYMPECEIFPYMVIVYEDVEI